MNAMIPRFSNVSLGFSPLAVSLLGSDDIDTLVVFEPKLLTLGVAFP